MTGPTLYERYADWGGEALGRRTVVKSRVRGKWIAWRPGARSRWFSTHAEALAYALDPAPTTAQEGE